jgi:N-acetylmuramic acid 6-phosphate (MurNAc-6-P) etherase
MIKLGKVAGPYMINVACINQKLIDRAQSLLKKLYGINGEDALSKLKDAEMDLSKVVKNIQLNQNH